MKRIVQFSRYFIPAAIISLLLVGAGAARLISDGFNLGIDFQAGLIEEVQLVPHAFSLAYDGPGNAVVSLSSSALTITISGVGVQGFSSQYLLSDYNTIDAFAFAINQIEGITAVSAAGSTPFRSLAMDSATVPILPASDMERYYMYYLPVEAETVSLEELRTALAVFPNPAVQVLGDPSERRFLIRMQDSDLRPGFNTAEIGQALENHFGRGEVAITSSNYVGSRFSQNLVDQVIWLISGTLVLILIYIVIRFKPQFAVGAVIGIINSSFIVVAFIVWSRMEFNVPTIAAILTVMGYSVNDTIVVFDRIRENLTKFPDDDFEMLLNRATTETLSRTFITMLTTLLAVVSLYIFTVGSMKDFALAVIVGLIAGPFSTIFIANGAVLFWEKKIKRKIKPKEAITEAVKS